MAFTEEDRETIRKIERHVERMAISQQQFDTDLAGLTTAIGTLIAAFETWRGSHPDLTTEDQSVATAVAQVQAELNNLNPPVPPPSPPPAPPP